MGLGCVNGMGHFSLVPLLQYAYLSDILSHTSCIILARELQVFLCVGLITFALFLLAHYQ